jgi:hypothetical protein
MSRLVFACFLAVSTPSCGLFRASSPSSGGLGMPEEITWDNAENGGNCGDIYRIDARGLVKSSSGCEEHAHAADDAQLDSETLGRLAEAVDRLRRSEEWNSAPPRCKDVRDVWPGTYLELRITERSGASKSWTFCAHDEGWVASDGWQDFFAALPHSPRPRGSPGGA